MKKILVMIMAVAMIAMMSVSVFAAGENIAPSATINAPLCSSWEVAAGINDGTYPAATFDQVPPHYGSWGSAVDNFETVGYTWDEEVTIDSIGLFFWRDTADRATWLASGGINLPASYTVQYWNGEAYVDVTNAEGLGIAEDTMNVTTFDAVTTTSIQITMAKFTADEEAGANAGYASSGLGIYEFEVYAAGADENAPQTGFATVALAVAAVLSGAYIASKKR